jgi:sec-independent protein translocase protein TatA
MFGMGWQELAFVLMIALLLFGAKRLPEIGRSLGRAISSFKDGLKEGENEAGQKSSTGSDTDAKP